MVGEWWASGGGGGEWWVSGGDLFLISCTTVYLTVTGPLLCVMFDGASCRLANYVLVPVSR